MYAELQMLKISLNISRVKYSTFSWVHKRCRRLVLLWFFVI